MLVDLHVHTSRYSPCGRSTPEEMLERAADLHLDGLALTEHNIVWPAAEIAVLQARYPQLRIFRGVEITADRGDHYLVLGADAPDAVEERLTGCEIARRARAAGGFVALAHPYRYGPDVPDSLEECPVHAIEVCSGNILNYAHEKAVALCSRLAAKPLATSDGHHVDTLGLYGVRLRRRAESDGKLAGLLREGAYTLYADTARIAAHNAALPALVRNVQSLIGSGRTDDEIHRELEGITYTLIRGIRDGLDIGRPT